MAGGGTGDTAGGGAGDAAAVGAVGEVSTALPQPPTIGASASINIVVFVVLFMQHKISTTLTRVSGNVVNFLRFSAGEPS